MGKEAIKSFDFVRAVLTLIIVFFHFCCHLDAKNVLPFYGFLNGSWGGTAVTAFFVLSGALLYYRYGNSNSNWKLYLYKRWKTIFPMYYSAYLFLEGINIAINKSIFFRGNPIPYLYTVLGMDHYLSQVTTTYPIIGEWFLGAILILYIMFPLILWCFSKNSNVTFIVALSLYIIFFNKPIINPIPYCSITSCLISFVCGMVIMKNRNVLLNKYTTIGSIILMLILCLVKIPISVDIVDHLMGVFLFCVLVFVGEYIMKKNIFNKIFKELSNASYAIFLLHSLILRKIKVFYTPSNLTNLIALLIVITIFIFIASKVFTIVINNIIKKLEDKFIKLE